MVAKVSVASARNKGYINDHVDVVPTESSDRIARTSANPSLRRYGGYTNTGFEVGDGPIEKVTDITQLMESPRKYNSIDLFSELPLDEALKRATKEAKERNIALYLLRGGAEDALDMYHREIIWKPDGWEPREG